MNRFFRVENELFRLGLLELSVENETNLFVQDSSNNSNTNFYKNNSFSFVWSEFKC